MITGLLESYRAETLQFKLKIEKIDLNELIDNLRIDMNLKTGFSLITLKKNSFI